MDQVANTFRKEKREHAKSLTRRRLLYEANDLRRDPVNQDGWKLNALNTQSAFSRRRLLRFTMAGMVGVTAGSLLSACGSDDDDDTETPATDDPAGADDPTPGAAESTEETDGTEGSSEHTEEQILRIPWLTVDTLDVNETQQYTAAITLLMHDGLFFWDTESGERVPLLAQSWEISDDLMVLTFALREDATWTDGTQVTANDFAYAIKRVLDPVAGVGGGGTYYFIDGAEAFNAGESTDPDSVAITATDEFTLEIQQAEPSVATLTNLERPDALAAPSWVIEEHGDRWTDPENIVSNGRFKLESWRLDQDITLVRNEDYWGEKPTLERIVFNLSAGQTAAGALAAYDTDEVDAATVEPTEIDRIKADPDEADNLIIHPDPKNQIDFIVFNSPKADSPVGDANVRRALYLAIDYDTYFSEVRKGLSTPIGGGIIPPGIVGHNPDAAPTGGVEEAKRLLTEAGYPDGEGFPGFKLTTSLDNGTYGLDGQIFQEMWRKNLGIEVEVELMEGTAFRAFRNSLNDPSADFDAFFIGTGGFDPTNWHVIALTFGGGRWENAEFDELVAQASLATDPDERQDLHAQAEVILMQEMPVLPYRVNGRGVLVKPWVHNFTEWPQNSPRPLRQDIYIEHS